MKNAEKRKFATAYHEAGHAVLSWYLRLPFMYVTVLSDKESGTLGHVRYYSFPKLAYDECPSRPLAQRDSWERHLMCSYAGRISEQIFRGQRVRYGYEGDYEQMADQVLKFGGESKEVHIHWCHWLHARTKNLVEQHWREIEAVAEALIKRERLSRREVQQTIDQLLGLRPLRRRPSR